MRNRPVFIFSRSGDWHRFFVLVTFSVIYFLYVGPRLAHRAP